MSGSNPVDEGFIEATCPRERTVCFNGNVARLAKLHERPVIHKRIHFDLIDGRLDRSARDRFVNIRRAVVADPYRPHQLSRVELLENPPHSAPYGAKTRNEGDGEM